MNRQVIEGLIPFSVENQNIPGVRVRSDRIDVILGSLVPPAARNQRRPPTLGLRESVKLGKARAKLVDSMLASVRAVRAQTPDFMRKVALGEATVDDATPPDAAAPEEQKAADLLGQGQVDDLSKVLAANMTWFIEWPHIDGRFNDVYASLAGFSKSRDY